MSSDVGSEALFYNYFKIVARSYYAARQMIATILCKIADHSERPVRRWGESAFVFYFVCPSTKVKMIEHNECVRIESKLMQNQYSQPQRERKRVRKSDWMRMYVERWAELDIVADYDSNCNRNIIPFCYTLWNVGLNEMCWCVMCVCEQQHVGRCTCSTTDALARVVRVRYS